MQAHKPRSLTVRDLVRAHGKAKRPSIVEVYCKGYVFPFVWFMGMDKRPQEDWLADVDKYCNTPRILSFDGNWNVIRSRRALALLGWASEVRSRHWHDPP